MGATADLLGFFFYFFFFIQHHNRLQGFQTTVPEREYACYMDEKMSPEPPKTLKWEAGEMYCHLVNYPFRRQTISHILSLHFPRVSLRRRHTISRRQGINLPQ